MCVCVCCRERGSGDPLSLSSFLSYIYIILVVISSLFFKVLCVIVLLFFVLCVCVCVVLVVSLNDNTTTERERERNCTHIETQSKHFAMITTQTTMLFFHSYHIHTYIHRSNIYIYDLILWGGGGGGGLFTQENMKPIMSPPLPYKKCLSFTNFAYFFVTPPPNFFFAIPHTLEPIFLSNLYFFSITTTTFKNKQMGTGQLYTPKIQSTKHIYIYIWFNM